MKAYLVSDKNDPTNEVIISITETSIRARSLAKTKHFKESSYFDLRASRYPDFDNYFSEETIITGKSPEVYDLLRRLGWKIAEEKKEIKN